MFKRRTMRLLALLGVLAMGICPARADTLVSRYRAVLSAQDRRSDAGVRLDDIGAVLMRDRANVFQLGRPDDGDQRDRIFMTSESQRLVRYMLDPATVPAPVVAAIAGDRDIVVLVEIWRGPRGDYLRIVPAAGP